MELERKAVAVLVEAVVEGQVLAFIAAAGRSGVEEVYGVLYLDVGCDARFNVCWVHHFSPLITAIRRRPYQSRLRLSIPLPQDLEGRNSKHWLETQYLVCRRSAGPRCRA